VHIEACEPPRHLLVAMDDPAGTWRLEAELIESDGVTTLRLTHHLDDSADPGSTGPDWEYYLDRLVAARDGTPMPEWDDYYPAQKAYYEEAGAELSVGQSRRGSVRRPCTAIRRDPGPEWRCIR
jgi:hypothetical protein